MGKHGVPGPLPAEYLLFADIVLKIAEAHPSALRQGGVKGVDGIVYALVHGLDPPVHIDLPLKLPGLPHAGEPLQLADELVALAPGDEFARLHRVHQQLELRELKGPLSDEPPGGPPLPALYVQPKPPQGLQVVIDAFALRRHAFGLQSRNELRHRHGVVLVRPLQQHPGQDQGFALLPRALRHVPLLPPPAVRRAFFQYITLPPAGESPLFIAGAGGTGREMSPSTASALSICSFFIFKLQTEVPFFSFPPPDARPPPCFFFTIE